MYFYIYIYKCIFTFIYSYPHSKTKTHPKDQTYLGSHDEKINSNFSFRTNSWFFYTPVFSGLVLADRYHAPEPHFDRLVENFYLVLLDPKGRPKHVQQQKR
jgi:hypothetical protein